MAEMLDRAVYREQFHSAVITPQVSLLQPATRDRLADLQHYFLAHVIAIGQTLRAQATIMGYADSFALIGVMMLTAILAVSILQKGAEAGAAPH